MKLRIATFNVENLFRRPKVMNFASWSEGQPYLDDYAKLTNLLNRETYSAQDKKAILKLLSKHKLTAARPSHRYFELRSLRGRLLERPKGKPPRVVANGRGDWLGWLELKNEAIADPAIVNTARVIAEVNADIIVLVEVENRPTLERFHDQMLMPQLAAIGAAPYPNNMVIDGNDSRGIDVGILSRHPIVRMRSHITDRTDGNTVFSRDCPEYYIDIGQGRELVILPNHFASKGSDRTGERRRVQSARAREIYQTLRASHAVAADRSARRHGPAPIQRLSGHLSACHRRGKNRLSAALARADQAGDARGRRAARLLRAHQMGVVRQHHQGNQGPLPGLGSPLSVGRARFVTLIVRRHSCSCGGVIMVFLVAFSPVEP